MDDDKRALLAQRLAVVIGRARAAQFALESGQHHDKTWVHLAMAMRLIEDVVRDVQAEQALERAQAEVDGAWSAATQRQVGT